MNSMPPPRKQSQAPRLRTQALVVASALACLIPALGLSQSNTTPVDTRPVVTIGFSNAPAVRSHAANGHFRPAAVYANETVTVRLEYLPAFAGVPIVATALDGGEVAVPRAQAAIDENGVAWIRFRAGQQPGLYRVLVLAGSKHSILEFWVDDPKNPSASPPAIRRGIKG
jgi:hypothetical protein